MRLCHGCLNMGGGRVGHSRIRWDRGSVFALDWNHHWKIYLDPERKCNTRSDGTET